MKTAILKLSVPNDFEKGCCYDCLLLTHATRGLEGDFCGCTKWRDMYDMVNCPLEVYDTDELEIKPVYYATWEINCDGYYPYCSNCGKEPYGREVSEFCPHCGAKMKVRPSHLALNQNRKDNI